MTCSGSMTGPQLCPMGWILRGHERWSLFDLVAYPESGLPVTRQSQREGSRRGGEKAWKGGLFCTLPACMLPRMGNSFPFWQHTYPMMAVNCRSCLSPAPQSQFCSLSPENSLAGQPNRYFSSQARLWELPVIITELVITVPCIS